jgi:hypothetical protein
MLRELNYRKGVEVAAPLDSLLLSLPDVSSSISISPSLASVLNFTVLLVLAVPLAFEFEAPSSVDSSSSSELLSSEELVDPALFSPLLSSSSSLEWVELELELELELRGRDGALTGCFRFTDFSTMSFALASFDMVLAFEALSRCADALAVSSSSSLLTMNSALNVPLLADLIESGEGVASLLDLWADLINFASDFAIADRSADDCVFAAIVVRERRNIQSFLKIKLGPTLGI